jgi:hypothetical protein
MEHTCSRVVVHEIIDEGSLRRKLEHVPDLHPGPERASSGAQVAIVGWARRSALPCVAAIEHSRVVTVETGLLLRVGSAA